MSVLVLAEHNGSVINAATHHAIAAARKIGGSVVVVIAGENVGSLGKAASRIQGVDRVLIADDPIYAHGLAEPLAALLAALGTSHRAVIAAATSVGKNTIPRAAALLDVQPLSDVVEILGADTFIRPIYAGNALATIRSSDPIMVMTVRITAFEASASDGGSAEIVTVASIPVVQRSHFEGRQVSVSGRPDLMAAKVIVSGGRGMQNAENFKLLDPLADSLGAAIGASRAAVDAGFVANDLQIGQTGKIVAPDLYIAIGISGAIQHLAGMKDSKVIVAINKDEEAPIFQVADYGLVADLFQVLPTFPEALRNPPL
ncbi:FAD-binding protein [Magnetospirillum sp. 15-1]|uniref:FAD-binding protein n=1 Tax=Magnetospirillum sp. 15-1 TaxID=1979370 RepID=UPI000BBCACB0|nr:FAD-binding protein [Magnetospirillum sp. 15-1]